MKKYRIFRRVMKSTKADRIWIGFGVFFIICTFVIWFDESAIKAWGDSFWYCFSLVSTCGFGDVVVVSPLSRILSVVLSFYAVCVIAILTGVIVNFYKNVIEFRMKYSLSEIADKIERLPELSKEELTEMANKFKQYRLGKNAGSWINDHPEIFQ